MVLTVCNLHQYSYSFTRFPLGFLCTQLSFSSWLCLLAIALYLSWIQNLQFYLFLHTPTLLFPLMRIPLSSTFAQQSHTQVPLQDPADQQYWLEAVVGDQASPF